jgi:class 3 adenylate cyclase
VVTEHGTDRLHPKTVARHRTLDPVSGTVMLLFTDMEGSTRLVQQFGEKYADILAMHNQLLVATLGDAGGHLIGTQGDALFFAFSRARDALSAAVSGQRAIAGHSWPHGATVRVRMGPCGWRWRHERVPSSRETDGKEDALSRT